MESDLLLMVRRKKIPEKGETQPATARQRARLEIKILDGNFCLLRNPFFVVEDVQFISIC